MNDLAAILMQANQGVGSAEAANALSRNQQVAALVLAFQRLAEASDTYTPTVTAGTGTFTSVAATGHYIQFGPLFWVSIVVTITTNGTAATSVLVTLPDTAATAAVWAGSKTSGGLLQGRIAAAGTQVALTLYDNTYPGADGAVLTASGWVEVS